MTEKDIRCVLNGKGKTYEHKSRGQVTPKKKESRNCRTKVVVKKVKSLAIGENPGTQKAIARSVGTSYATVKRIIRCIVQTPQNVLNRAQIILKRYCKRQVITIYFISIGKIIKHIFS